MNGYVLLKETGRGLSVVGIFRSREAAEEYLQWDTPVDNPYDKYHIISGPFQLSYMADGEPGTIG